MLSTATLAQNMTILQYATHGTDRLPEGFAPRAIGFTSEASPIYHFSLFKPGTTDFDDLNTYLYNQNNISTLQSMSIQSFGGSHTMVSTELASFFFGPVRLGVSGTFQTSGDSTKDAAVQSSLQKILNNGGAVNLNFAVPVYFIRTKNDQLHFIIFGQSNNGINPGITGSGSTTLSNNVSFANQTGLNFHFDITSNVDQKARISIDLPCFYSINSNNLKNELMLPNYSAVRLQVGVVLGDLLNLHISGPVVSSSSKVQSAPYQVSLQFSPAQIVK